MTGGDADCRVCSQNLSHTVNLFLRSDGTIGFSRWEHLGNVNDVKLFKVNPDCTQMLPVAGQHGKPFNSIVQVKEVRPEVMVGIATRRNGTLHSGALFEVDAHAPPGSSTQTDEEHAKFTNLTPGVPTGKEPSPLGRYRTPNILPDGRLLVSWAQGFVNEQNELEQVPVNFGVYVYDTQSKNNILVYDDPKFSELYAAPLAARPAPPVIYDVAKRPIEPARGHRLHRHHPELARRERLRRAVRQAPAQGGAQAGGGRPRHRGLLERDWLDPHVRPHHARGRRHPRRGAGVRRRLVGREDPRVRAGAPPADRQVRHVHPQPGAVDSRACPARPAFAAAATSRARRLSSRARARASRSRSRRARTTCSSRSGLRQEFGWDVAIQPILDKKCVSCHGSDSALAKKTYKVVATDRDGKTTEYSIPWLDLSGAPMSVSFEMGVYSFSRSYVSLYYPSQLRWARAASRSSATCPPSGWPPPTRATRS